MKYARYLPEEQRRENWNEIVTRNMNMHIKTYPELSDQIRDAYRFVYAKKVLPSMRSMQFGGKAIEVANNRIYNCAYMPVEDPRAFQEAMFLLLGGTGVGYSVQTQHVQKMPMMVDPHIPDDFLARLPEHVSRKRFVVPDSIEGWADAIGELMAQYFEDGITRDFDYSQIRPKGARLKTSGGTAPGPEPLVRCIENLDAILRNCTGTISSLECHDMMCHIADAVLAGGIRRAAMISLFSGDDKKMLESKSGNWYETNPQRSRANNSIVLVRDEVSRDQFNDVFKQLHDSDWGEPGFYFTNDKEWGTNPCCEIALKPYQFCNLTEINASDLESQGDLLDRAKAAAFIGTLQAGYTKFHYLRDEWRTTTEEEALIGVSMTGIASGAVLKLNMREAAELVKAENARVAQAIGINKAARTTCVKPAGTTSLTLGTSSGIHAWHNDYYIRRIRVNKTEPIYQYLSVMHPELVEDEDMRPDEMAVIHLPQEAPVGAITRDESAFDLLDRVQKITEEWVKPGHRTGVNTHNVSATISLKPEDWHDANSWMWHNRDCYNGLSVLPFSGGGYKQAPFEDIDEDTYYELVSSLVDINLDNVFEAEDRTTLAGELACAGGQCEIR